MISASNVGSTTLLNFSFLVGEVVWACGPGPPGPMPGPAGTTDMVGIPIDPGWSGWIPSLRRQTRLNISILESSVGFNGRVTAAVVSVAAVTSICKPATVLSHAGLAMNATSLNFVGRPRATSRMSSNWPVVPAQFPTSAKVAIVLSSVSVGSILSPDGGDWPLTQG